MQVKWREGIGWYRHEQYVVTADGRPWLVLTPDTVLELAGGRYKRQVVQREDGLFVLKPVSDPAIEAGSSEIVLTDNLKGWWAIDSPRVFLAEQPA
jgi:hypothetical protein